MQTSNDAPQAPDAASGLDALAALATDPSAPEPARRIGRAWVDYLRARDAWQAAIASRDETVREAAQMAWVRACHAYDQAVGHRD